MNMLQTVSANDKNALGVTYETANLVGKRLLQARLQRRLSPSQVSARVKIRDRYIEAIETGDWDVLPPGLNGRGLIRLYARELGVAIPEFEAFHHLQTVMVEKQSESLMAASNKKSKYHPAAEESAEVIRSISRSEFQKGIHHIEQSDYVPIVSASPDDSSYSAHSNSVKTFTRPLYTPQRGGGGGIVTPNIYDVLGIELEEAKEDHHQAINESKQESFNPVAKQSLPTAEPVKSPVPDPAPVFAMQTHLPQNSADPSSIFKKDFPTVSKKDSINKDEKNEPINKKSVDLIPIKIVIGLAFVVVFVFVSIILYSRNSSQIKVTNLSAKQIEGDLGNGESLPSSIVEANIPQLAEQKGTEYPPQTKTVASGTAPTGISSQKVTTAMVIERVAKLDISSKVNISIEADGQQIFSGTHAAGVVEIPFKNKAEIIITDASKASLTYEGIDHGQLGYAGRKRKIVINAKPYVE